MEKAYYILGYYWATSMGTLADFGCRGVTPALIYQLCSI
jgi:hypothetical protein